MLNLCCCGTEAGFRHPASCPFPAYNATGDREARWTSARTALVTGPHRFIPWVRDPERCQVCDRPAMTAPHGDGAELGDRHALAAGQATLPAILVAILLAVALVLSLHIGVVATADALLAHGW